MKKEYKIQLNNIISELSYFLERDFSSQFRNLSNKEDRQLFFLAKILTRLKKLSRNMSDEEKILLFPPLITKS
ncbi:MAG: hypothetical protein HY094_03630 [Candidatus Melainabacteria bacterium]|nr:hypothetical protein [Candidatus Melainabacteria bacterium]